ncbi:MAG: hypothetical protein JEZ07_10925 [Phycisphaerae bacterium]|nr:hypothetical protein [Phycisphaerae bacterium]
MFYHNLKNIISNSKWGMLIAFILCFSVSMTFAAETKITSSHIQGYWLLSRDLSESYTKAKKFDEATAEINKSIAIFDKNKEILGEKTHEKLKNEAEIALKYIQDSQANKVNKVNQVNKVSKVSKVSDKTNKTNLTATTQKTKELDRPLTPMEREAKAIEILATQIIELEYDEESLEFVLTDIADRSKLTIFPEWPKILNMANIQRDKRVVIPKCQVPVGNALEMVLAYVSGDADARLGYSINQFGIVKVSIAPKNYGYKFNTFYVGDITQSRNIGGGGMGMGYGGQGGYGNNSGGMGNNRGGGYNNNRGGSNNRRNSYGGNRNNSSNNRRNNNNRSNRGGYGR